MRTCWAWVGGAIALVVAPAALGDLITFEGLAGLGNPHHTDLVVEGYEFSAPEGMQTIDSDPGGIFVHDASQVTLARDYTGYQITMRREGGGTFDLTGFDAGGLYLHPWNGGPSADTLHLTGLLPGGGTVLVDVPLGVLWGQPFVHRDVSGLTGVEAVIFDGSAVGWQGTAAFQLDNLIVVPGPGAGVVVSAALLVMGRRRRGGTA